MKRQAVDRAFWWKRGEDTLLYVDYRLFLQRREESSQFGPSMVDFKAFNKQQQVAWAQMMHSYQLPNAAKMAAKINVFRIPMNGNSKQGLESGKLF